MMRICVPTLVAALMVTLTAVFTGCGKEKEAERDACDPDKTWVRPPVKGEATRTWTPLPSKWDGFRGVRWLSSPDDTPGMTLAKDWGSTKFYWCKGDPLAIGEAKLKSIVYQFHKGRFWQVKVETEGRSNWAALGKAVFARYSEEGEDEPFWSSARYWMRHVEYAHPVGHGEWGPVIPVDVSLFRSKEDDDGKFEMYYGPMLTVVVDSDKAEAEVERRKTERKVRGDF